MPRTLPVLLVDLLVVAVVLLAARRGWRVGAAGGAVRLAGTLLGLFVGLLLARSLSDRLGPVGHVVVGLGCALGGLLIGSALGRSAGAPVTAGLRGLHLGTLDRTVGALVRALVALVLVGIAAAVVVAFAPAAWADPVRASRLAPDSASDVPLVGPLYDDAAKALQAAAPGDLAALLPTSSGRAPDDATVRQLDADTAASVGLVSVDSCGRSSNGTGFVVADQLVVTNAHVVQGATTAEFRAAIGDTVAATVVDVDRRADLAFLRVPDLDVTPLTVADQDAANGTAVAVVGYPGGDRDAVGGAVEQRLPMPQPGLADGFAVHQSYRVSAPIRHGNSGSPLLDTAGRVVGVVNALLGDAGRSGLAITASELRADLASARTDTTPVPSGTCG